MSLENEKLSQKNRLPLDVRESQLLAKSGESDVWKADVTGSSGQKERIVLKQNRREKFATEAEMKRSKEYYEFLKGFPGFGRFVPDTLYFKAQAERGAPAQAYCIQNLLSGKTINRVSDEELHKDPTVKKQLLEFVDGAIAILRETRKQNKGKPDFGKSADDDVRGTQLANSALSLRPRYSNNIFISTEPDEQGRRVFFVDTGEGVRENGSDVASMATTSHWSGTGSAARSMERTTESYIV